MDYQTIDTTQNDGVRVPDKPRSRGVFKVLSIVAVVAVLAFVGIRASDESHKNVESLFTVPAMSGSLLRSSSRLFMSDGDAAWKEQLVEAKQLVTEMIESRDCAPIMVRLAWHDAGTFDNRVEGKPWPAQGGAIGSIRYDKEITAGPNAGLKTAIAYLTPIKKKVDLVSWADLIQMASAIAIELAGGPKIDMIYGRVDAEASPEESVAPFGLPDALPKFGGPPENAEDAAAHLRWVFGKYGMTDKEITALSGAHTLGRAFKDRSGTVDNESGPKNPTKYTSKEAIAEQGNGKSMPGGKSWTQKWLKFDNSYFQMKGTEEPKDLVAFPTDVILSTESGFKPFFDKYRDSEEAFFADYADAHKKLSELGAKWVVEGGVRI